MQSTPTSSLLCDGCGQPASPEHIALRLHRLEDTTRYRPVHIHAVFLAAASPPFENDFLYSPAVPKGGEALAVLAAAGVAAPGSADGAREAALAEFQRKGFLLTHFAECPLDASLDGAARQALFAGRLPALLARLRRSLRPKRVILLGEELAGFATALREANFAEIVCSAPENSGASATDARGAVSAAARCAP